MNQTMVGRKRMSLGEGGLALGFSFLAFASIVGIAEAQDAPLVFHAYLAAAASIAPVFAILNRSQARPVVPPVAEINGRPKYNMGPVKIRRRRGDVLGSRRLRGRTPDRAAACLIMNFIDLGQRHARAKKPTNPRVGVISPVNRSRRAEETCASFCWRLLSPRLS